MEDAKGRIKYDNTLLKVMQFFETMTRAKLRDCFIDQNDAVVFIVEAAQSGLAIGKGGANARKLEESLKKKVKVVEYSDNVEEFTKSLIQPAKAQKIEFSEGVVTITPEPGSRSYLIGRAGKNVRNFEAAIKRHFPIRELRVL